MNIIYIMIPLGLVLLGVAVGFFFWAVRSGQFDDLEIQGSLVLFDDEGPARPVKPRVASTPTPAPEAPR